MVSTEHDFLKARTQIIGKIQSLEKELKYWRDELGAFDRVETTMRRLGANGREPTELKLSTQDGKTTAPSVSESDLQALKAYAQSNPPKRGDLKRLVLKAVENSGGKLVSSKDVERTLLQSGYKPAGKHFDISVYQTLCRLAFDQKMIQHKRDAGKLRFTTRVKE